MRRNWPGGKSPSASFPTLTRRSAKHLAHSPSRLTIPAAAHYRYYVPRSTHDEATPAGLGRYSDPPLLVLASLADGPKHGHAMMAEIERMSGTRLGPGTLYGAIARLEREGLIEPLSPEERRQPYRLTPRGLRLLSARLATLQHFARAGLRKLEAQVARPHLAGAALPLVGLWPGVAPRQRTPAGAQGVSKLPREAQ
ncbi:MAG: PadR family transcriptional regulator [Terriglobales bacterium]